MSGAGFFAGTISPAAITSNQLIDSAPNVCVSKAVTFSGVVVVTIAKRKPRSRASLINRSTPGRKGIAPVDNSVV